MTKKELVNELQLFFDHIGYEEWKDEDHQGIILKDCPGWEEYHLGVAQFKHLYEVLQKALCKNNEDEVIRQITIPLKQMK